jgi:hypothetical protein|tara:strand:+ start:725 stop:1372 length:648 start_codon:yes stop_codon:yes gene_type:complete
MRDNDGIKVHRPFGPVLCEFRMSKNTVDTLNNFVDGLEKDSKLRKELNAGANLAGQVSEEIRVPEEVSKQGIGPELSRAIATYVLNTTGQTIKKLTFISIWIVRQYGTEYNPVHYHDGHLSGAGWLKVPNDLGQPLQENKDNYNGKIQFVHGSRLFNCASGVTVKPEVGRMFVFPAYLMHTVYPFYGKEERRSVAFNANIDNDIYNPYRKSLRTI